MPLTAAQLRTAGDRTEPRQLLVMLSGPTEPSPAVDTEWLQARADALWNARRAAREGDARADTLLAERLSLEVVRLPGSGPAAEADTPGSAGAAGETMAAAEAAAAGGRLLARFAQPSRPYFLLGRPRRVPQGVGLPLLPPLVRVLLREAERGARRLEVLDAAEWEAVLRCE